MRFAEPEVAKHYILMQIETASRQKQLTMLHEKCVQLMHAAIIASREDRRMILNRAQNILAQFQASLRVEDAVSQGLFYIYDYAYILLEKGGINECRKAIQVMSVIRDTFRELLLNL